MRFYKCICGIWFYFHLLVFFFSLPVRSFTELLLLLVFYVLKWYRIGVSIHERQDTDIDIRMYVLKIMLSFFIYVYSLHFDRHNEISWFDFAILA